VRLRFPSSAETTDSTGRVDYMLKRFVLGLRAAANFQLLPMGPDLEAAGWNTLEPTFPI
jgi:hypothetical protein